MVKKWIGTSIALSTLITVVTGLMSPSAFAGTAAEIQMSGTVAPALKLVTPPIDAELMLNTDTSTDIRVQPVAQVSISTNGEQRYDLRVNSSDLTNGEDRASSAQIVVIQSDIQGVDSENSSDFNPQADAAKNLSASETWKLFIRGELSTSSNSKTYRGTILLSVVDQ